MKSASAQILLVGASLCVGMASIAAPDSESLVEGATRATLRCVQPEAELRTYELTSNAELRDNKPPDKRVTYAELPDHATLRTGSLLFDGLYALAVHEAKLLSVSQIKDYAYGNNTPTPLEVFQTGEVWTYVWTRDQSYSTHLALGQFDPPRSVNSLLFKTSVLKPSVHGGCTNQIIQDTGSGGSYPISSDRVVWALGASEALKYLSGSAQQQFLARIYPILRDTIEQDRHLVFDPQDGLYRGEESFLDWREQTYPGWTRDNVLAIGLSKALSVNVANVFLLGLAADYAGQLGHPEEAVRYREWAKELKAAINRDFFDSEAGMYSAYLLSDGGPAIRAHHYDLLAQSLAILVGVADEAQAVAVLRHYPVGPYGPSVVWPQEQTVPIYHNQAIWPFVTAYWTKAARRVGNATAVDSGIRSLMRGPAFDLSNMENYDFVSGLPQVKGKKLDGPVVNSRRQLWSVAAYLSMVQDIVFGLETTQDGIRFLPFVTGQLRNSQFPSSAVLELRNFGYQGKRIDVRVHLPAAGAGGPGACAIREIQLNGKTISQDFVSTAPLQDRNQWDIYLEAPSANTEPAQLNLVTNVNDERAIFAPLQPQWSSLGENGLLLENGLPVLHFEHPDAAHLKFNIYRDGRMCAGNLADTRWVDAVATADSVHFYAVEAVDPRTGNRSHLTPTRCCRVDANQWSLPASRMEHRGGTLTDGGYVRDWGKPEDELVVSEFTVGKSGGYLARVEFANGAGPVNTGITCGVKKLEIRKIGSAEVVAEGYVVMPQSGDWWRWDLSTPVRARLRAGEKYSLRLFEDEYARNMSYLENNERYTAWPGGGPSCYNFVNIAAVHLLAFGENPVPAAEAGQGK